MQYFKDFLRKHPGKLCANILLILLQSIATLLLPFLVAALIDQGILQGDMQAIYRIGGQMLLITLAGSLISLLASWYAADFSALFGKQMRNTLFRKSHALSLEQQNSLGLSSLMTRATADVSAVQASIGMVLQLVVPAPLLIGVALVFSWRAHPIPFFVLLTSIVLLLLFCLWILRRSGAISQSLQEKLDRINLLVREGVSGTRVIRAFGRESYEEQRAGEAFSIYARAMIRLGRMFAVVSPAVWLLLGLSLAGMLWFGGLLAGQGDLPIGQIAALCEYAILGLSYLIMAGSIVVTLPKTRACLLRLQEVLDLSPAVVDAPTAQNHVSSAAAANTALLQVQNLQFSYPGAEAAVLTDLSFSCLRGQTTAVIGGTGSGKSSLCDLLLRLHEPSLGRILLEGQDLRKLTQQTLRARLSCVPQKAFLFRGTIAENLRMGEETATEEELWAALRLAQAESFVAALPLGLESPVAQGGTNFSGGQRQRLCIARALVRRAAVYLFDDSFSALDAKTEEALRAALQSFASDSAKIIVAQRVSSIAHADQILVLEEGRLVGCGRHEDLLKSCPDYRAIVHSQTLQEVEVSS